MEVPVFRNEKALKEAFQALTWTLKENEKIRTYPRDPNRDVVYPVVAVNPDVDCHYDIGVVRSPNGVLDLVADSLMAKESFERTLGKGFLGLSQQYNIANYKQYARNHGGVAHTHKLSNGDVRMELEVYA